MSWLHFCAKTSQTWRMLINTSIKRVCNILSFSSENVGKLSVRYARKWESRQIPIEHFTIVHLDRLSIFFEKCLVVSACPLNLTLPELPENVKCSVPEYCTGLECCVYIELIRKSINVKFLLDACSYKLTLAIEKRESILSLLDYEWGKWKLIIVTNGPFVCVESDSKQRCYTSKTSMISRIGMRPAEYIT